jgi:hypothetical protein
MIAFVTSHWAAVMASKSLVAAVLFVPYCS